VTNAALSVRNVARAVRLNVLFVKKKRLENKVLFEKPKAPQTVEILKTTSTDRKTS
jgi:hypothetical protein